MVICHVVLHIKHCCSLKTRPRHECLQDKYGFIILKYILNKIIKHCIFILIITQNRITDVDSVLGFQFEYEAIINELHLNEIRCHAGGHACMS
jgi:hypothetical protein